MSLPLPFVLLAASAVVYAIYRRYTRISISHIPGPEPESFLLGNLRELFQGQAAEADFKWQAQFGNIVRLKAPFGEDCLLVSDPKALQHIHHNLANNFIQPDDRREQARLLAGRGILWAQGNDHTRHRKLILPSFSLSEIKSFVPVFSAYAGKLSTVWRDIIASTADESAVLDIMSWLSRTTLDAMGDVGFDYSFGTMENDKNPLAAAYSNMVLETFGTPTTSEVFVQNTAKYIPLWIRRFKMDHFPAAKLHHALNAGRIATDVAKSLVASKSEALLRGKGNRDIMSLLVKANVSENAKTNLNEEEMLAQMRTFLLAGHGTTSNSFSWTILELSRRPEMQTRLRDEIRATQEDIQNRGDHEYTIADFDKMPYLTAVVKESLRYHPVVYMLFRQAIKDDILPLSKPITTTSGAVINEIPIPSGLRIISSTGSYNRNKDVFGEDAHVFNPDRWLNNADAKKTSLGVVGNLYVPDFSAFELGMASDIGDWLSMSFGGGSRSCLGWKFAIVELQAFLAELVGNFEFSLTLEAKKVRRESCLIMAPTIEGQVDQGARLPLKVKVASRERG